MNEFLEYINDMQFTDIDELFVKKAYVREKYQNLDYNYRMVYKWYYYFQLTLLKNPLKSVMWDYLNGYNVTLELNHEYLNFCEKRDKLRAKYVKDNVRDDKIVVETLPGQTSIWDVL